MIISITELKTMLSQLEAEGNTHVLAFWRTIPDIQVIGFVSEDVDESETMTRIEEHCGDFQTVHAEIDSWIEDTFAEMHDEENEQE